MTAAPAGVRYDAGMLTPLALLAACAGHPDSAALDSSPQDTGPATRTVITLSSYFGGAVFLYDEDGAPLGVIDGVDGAQTVVLSPSGELVACAEQLNQVLRFDPTTFEPLGVLVDGAGVIDGPTAAVFGPEGDLYVASFEDDRVARFTADGVYVDDAVTPGEGGLDGPDIGLAFGPDGALYVPSWYNGGVLAYSGGGVTEVVAPGSGWSGPRALAWDDGTLLVAMNGDNAVVRVDAGVATFVEPRRPAGLAILGDKLLVSSEANDKVQAYDLATGELVGAFIDDDAIDGATSISVHELPAP